MLRGISVFLRIMMSRAGHDVATGMFQHCRCWIEGMSEELRVKEGELGSQKGLML